MPNTVSSGSPARIDPEAVYPLDEFKRLARFGVASMRTARRNGLRVRYANGRAFVKGADFIRYLDDISQQQFGREETR